MLPENFFKITKLTKIQQKIILAVYKKLVSGMEFKRALSAPDMKYFIKRISEEDDAGALLNSVSALWKHIEYYEEKANVSLNSMREVALNFSANINSRNLINDFEREFQDKVLISLKDNENSRKLRIKNANKKPNLRVISITIFERNPDVVAETLLRAKGICQHCKSPAPFRRHKDNSPYLEVHHIKRLADGGEDTIENTIALCPNCHRKVHFGS